MKTQVETQTIGQKMQARQIEARETIKAQLWADTPDADQIADVALKAGLDPATVDKLAGEIEEAKTQLAELSGIDLPAMKLESERATGARDRASVTLEKAQQVYDTAAAAAADAGATFDSAFQKFRAAACAATAGSLPGDRLPGIIQKITNYDKAVDFAQGFHSEAAQDRIERDKLSRQVEALTEAKKSADDSKQAGVTVMDLAGNDGAKGINKRLKDAKRDLAAVLKRIAGHGAEQAKRDRAVADAKTAIWM